MRVGRGGASSMPPQHRNSIEMSASAMLQQQIDVRLELSSHRMFHGVQIDLDSFLAGKFRHRHEIGISRHQNQHVNDSLQGNPCDVEADADVHSLLRHVGNEVFSGHRSWFLHEIFQGVSSQFPARLKDLATPDGEVGLKLQRIYQPPVVLRLRRAGEIDPLPGDRIDGRSFEGRSVVVVDSGQFLSRKTLRGQSWVTGSGEKNPRKGVQAFPLRPVGWLAASGQHDNRNSWLMRRG